MAQEVTTVKTKSENGTRVTTLKMKPIAPEDVPGATDPSEIEPPQIIKSKGKKK